MDSHLARHIGCTPDVADDLVQDTFLTVFSVPFADRGGHATARFLRETARFVFLHHVRGETRRKLREERARVRAVEQVWREDRCRDDGSDDGETYLDSLRRCLDELAPRSRQAVDLAYSEVCGRADIARRLGLKETGVKTLLQRARRALRACVERRTTS